MNPRFHAAIGEAMSRLRTSDVTGATTAIQYALAGQGMNTPAAPDISLKGSGGSKAAPARGLRAIAFAAGPSARTSRSQPPMNGKGGRRS